MKNFYITTPIYYPNAKPHIGTAYTTVLCDAMARYKRLKGYNVVFVTGTDEHGQKIQESALKNNVTPKQWVDKMKDDFIYLWDKLNISYDNFVRTTSKEHYENVKNIVKKVYENGDIYAGEYIGKYCVSEETFVTESQLVDGKYLGKEVIDMKEKTYFFKLSKYQDKLLKFYEENPNFIIPSSKKNEVLSFIKQGLLDVSISRTTFNWGIPLEMEEGHVIYVWFDALNSYITGAGSYGSEKFDQIWNNGSVNHMVGKDILRFHAILWPAMLMSAGIKTPDHLAVHGWWTVDGEKMSKSLGNVVDPLEEIEKYGVDAFRYFLLRDSSFGQDADYSKIALINRINSDLANDLGNLLNRVIGMSEKYFESNVYKVKSDDDLTKDLYQKWELTLDEVDNYYSEYNFSEMIKSILKYVSRLNKYIDETEPWTLFKNNEIDKLKSVLYNLVNGIYKVAILISPVIPDTSIEILNQLSVNRSIKDLKIEDILDEECYPDNMKLSSAKILFKRIEVPKKEFDDELKISNPLKIDDFNKLSIKCVSIKNVYRDEENKHLLRFIIDTGSEIRQVVSAVAKSYSDEKILVNKKVMAILNLEIANIKGHISQGMLLTTATKKKNELIFLNDDIKVGTTIK